MKACPSCRRTYPDDAPNFCPQDGTQLVSNSPAYYPPSLAANVSAPQMSYTPPYNQPSYAQPQAQAPSIPVRLPSNPMRKWVKISQFILVVSIVLLLVALLSGLILHGPAVLTILTAIFGGTGLLFGFIGHFSYRKQAETIDEMFRKAGHPEAMRAGGNLLAHWTYSPQEWSQFVQSEIARRRGVKIILFVIMLFVFVIMLITFLSSSSRRGGMTFGPLVMFLIISALIGLFVWWIATAEVRHMKAQTTGEAFIAKNGLLFNDHYYPWGGLGYSLAGVFYEQGNPNTICFRYLSLKGGTSAGPHYVSVHVPVPFGREAEAQNVVAQFHR